MKSKCLNIVIIDGNFELPTFIARLVEGLAQRHNVYVYGFNTTLLNSIPNVAYVSLGSNQNKWKLIVDSFKLVIKLLSLKSFLNVSKLILIGDRTKLQKLNIKHANQTIKPDIIHLQWPSLIPVMEDILTEQQIPIVLSQRGFHINVRPFVNEENFQYLKKWFPKITAFHSVSQAISEVGNKIFNAPEKIDSIIYSGLNMHEYNRIKGQLRNDKLEIISVGRSHWKKGYDDALNACKRLKQQGFDFHYTLIGVGEDEEILFRIKDYGLESNVSCLEKLSHSKVKEIMRLSDLLLLPSIEEGIANVAIEAMALGLPVLSSNVGGMDEILEENFSGLIFQSRDVKELVVKILEFASYEPSEIKKIRLSAREFIEGQHDINKTIPQFEKFYKSVI